MIPICQFLFNLPLGSNQIPAFRGAVIRAMGDVVHPLMHNHEESGYRFGYPLVQYKSIGGCAAIVAIGDVGDFLYEYFQAQQVLDLVVQKRKVACALTDAHRSLYVPEIEDAPKYYRLTDYLPLTNKNVEAYDSLMALTDKICFIEKILTGNILSFFKGIGYTSEQQIVPVVTSIDLQHTIVYKKVHFRAFDLHFVSNVVLPDGIGLGKSTSIGMGSVKQEPLPEQFKHYLT